MIIRLSDTIISPLGDTSERNLEVLLRGESCLCRHETLRGETLVEPFVGSVFEQLPHIEGYTAFESLCIRAAADVLAAAGIDPKAADCRFVLSTTKGDILVSPAETANHIAAYFGCPSAPIVVSTACTSGVAAQLTAYQLLTQHRCRTVVLIGAELQSEFIVSGFQSFKALADGPCRPFDKNRTGLNVGEAAAAMVLQWRDEATPDDWCLLGGSVHNDANHISGPSRTAEGSLRCLNDMLRLLPKEEVSFVSVHGTATAYNDEMESIALQRAGLTDCPVSALKGYYGHTMGCAGVLETILSIHAANRGLVLPARGFAEQGTTYPVDLSPETRSFDGVPAFIKLLSGFGGVNAAVAWKRGMVDGGRMMDEGGLDARWSDFPFAVEADELVACYRKEVGDYPKFFKMDQLSRIALLAADRIKSACPEAFDAEETGVVLCSRSASLVTDRKYMATIEDKQAYYPSPATFVYTLPNIASGELAIRHHLYGPSLCYVVSTEEEGLELAKMALVAGSRTVLFGWLEVSDETHYSVNFKILQ